MSKNISYVINSPKVLSETIEGETVIIHLGSGFYYSIDKRGSAIWELVINGETKESVVTDLTERLGQSREVMEKEVDYLINKFIVEDLVKIADGESVKKVNTVEIYNSIKHDVKFEPSKLNKFTDMHDLLLLDPIHDVSDEGWPNKKPDVSEKKI